MEEPRRAFVPSPPAALYIHVPFCLSVCPYCDFVVYGGAAARGARSRVDALVDGLETEIRLRGMVARDDFGPGWPRLASIYFGGGTPSLLSARQVERLLEAAAEGFGLVADAEVTIEANPGPADRGDLAGFRACGVNRLSIGAQSMVEAELRRLGRRHSPSDVARTVAEARQAGFDNVSLDLLYDVPAQTLASWRRSLAAALRLEPDHVSAYALALDDPDGEGLTGPNGDHLPLRPGARRWRRSARTEQDEDRAAACYELADQLLGRAGLGWYELSNWSRPGAESVHNMAYWRRAPHQAVGPGAHAFDGAFTRRWNAARLDGYLAALSADSLPPGGRETVDEATASAELAILNLRTRTGLPASLASSPALRSALSSARANGLLETTDDSGYRLTMTGRLLSNEVFARLLPELAPAVAVA